MNRELTSQEQIINLASKYIGLQEILGDNDNPIIMNMFKEIGQSWVKHDETSWCSCFINFIAYRLNLIKSGKLNARSWLDVGIKTENPIPGDIVIYWREKPDSWKGHVGIFMGYNQYGNIFTLGGNQHNEVNITVYSKDRLLGFRTLEKL